MSKYIYPTTLFILAMILGYSCSSGGDRHYEYSRIEFDEEHLFIVNNEDSFDEHDLPSEYEELKVLYPTFLEDEMVYLFNTISIREDGTASVKGFFDGFSIDTTVNYTNNGNEYNFDLSEICFIETNGKLES